MTDAATRVALTPALSRKRERERAVLVETHRTQRYHQ
jgi:hypothetical protein